MNALLILLIMIPAVGGASLCLAGSRANRLAPTASISVSAVLLVLAVPVALIRPAWWSPFLPGTGFELRVDALSAPLLPTVASVTLLALVFASSGGRQPASRFHGLMLLFASAVLVTLTAGNLAVLLFAWELMGAASYALIGFSWHESRHVSSGLTAFITTRAGDLGLYLAAGAVLAGGGTLHLSGLAQLPDVWRNVAAAGILVAAFGKAAQLPFSFWLSRAMDGPSAVSALLHSAAMVAMGGYLLLRVQPLLQATSWAATTTAWVGVSTTVVLGVVALAQKDLKQLLAASTSAQLGFVVLAAGVGSVAGGNAHLMAHAMTKAGLFLAAGAWLAALGTKQLSALRGAARRWPFLGVAFTVAGLSLAGMAPFALWATKDTILGAAREESLALYLAGVLGAALSAAYAGKALALVWRPLPQNPETAYDTEESGSRRIPRWQQVSVAVLALGSAVGGLLVFGPAGHALRTALKSGPGPDASELAVSAAITALVLAVVWHSPTWFRSRRAHSWFGLEQAATLAVVQPTFAIAGLLARFDDRVLDRGIDHLAGLVPRAARHLGRFDDRPLDQGIDRLAGLVPRTAGRLARVDEAIDAAVEGSAGGIHRAGQLARLPQTGLIHQYYAQAALLLAVATILLIFTR